MPEVEAEPVAATAAVVNDGFPVLATKKPPKSIARICHNCEIESPSLMAGTENEPRKAGEFIILILQTLLPLLANCPKKPNTPQPPADDTPKPAEITQSNWDKAKEARAFAWANYDEAGQEYAPPALRRASVALYRKNKRTGEPMTRAEAFVATRNSLDEARTGTMLELAESIQIAATTK